MPELAGALRPLPAHAASQLDRLVTEAIELGTRSRMEAALKYLTSELGLPAATWQKDIDPSELPVAGVQAETGAFIVKQRSPAGGWIVEDMHGSRHMLSLPSNARYVGIGGSDAEPRGLYKSASELFRGVLREHRSFFVQAAIASVVINALALMTSLYSMQIYDRVIPTQGLATLYTLTAGVGISIVLELVGKFARASILDQAIRSMDTSLSHSIFERLLRVRMDQFPSSVGTLSGQLRSYEQIRSFASAVTLYLLVDGPFALLFLLVIYLLGGPWVAAVPMAFFVISLSLGFLYRGAMERHARSGMMASHRKLGLLVESVEGAEAIKSTNSSWKFLARWNALSRVNIDQDMHLRHLGEAAGYYASFLQQASYVLLIAVGAYVASTSTTLTAGGLIACSILSGRVLTPVGMLPGLMVQWANAKSALTSIAQIFSLEQDNHGVDRPMAIDHIDGDLTVRALEFGYRGHDTILRVDALHIRRGEKVGLLGTVGSGKSTLLK
ncbi:MAG: ABC transporter transmembrane domain-containing protein, partial [Variovorax sp.]